VFQEDGYNIAHYHYAHDIIISDFSLSY